MKGIQYVTDENGKRTAVLIDLKRYSTLWEEFRDSKNEMAPQIRHGDVV